MDRNAIERDDFPMARRGYDPAAVGAHLRRVADEMEALRARTGLSAGTSGQVREILEAAERSAAAIREQAGREAGEHVGRVGEAVAVMMSRVDQLGQELDALLDSLRRSCERLQEGLARLQEDVGAAAGAPVQEEEDHAAAAPAAVEPALDEPADADAFPAPAAPEPDEAGARLIALNMALGGTPREETARYLAEHYELADAEALLDDVYRRAGA